MAIPPAPPLTESRASAFSRTLGRARMTFVFISFAVLIVSLGFSWSTRDAMENLPFLKNHGSTGKSVDSQKTLVDLRPWQTASTLASMVVTNEEAQYAQEAERLADHEVDQAFSAALREASARVQRLVLTGDALELSRRVAELEQLVKDDKAQVAGLTTSGAGTGANGADSDDLEIAKAQLGLDNDQLNDAQEDLARASGDDRSEIQQELSDREATMKKYDSDGHVKGQAAVASAKGYSTLAARIGAWRSQISRRALLEQARQLALSDVASLTKEHNALQAAVNSAAQATNGVGAGQAADHAAKLADLRERSAERQLLSIYDDRIQTEKQLAAEYGKWADQVTLQHRILFHLILQSVAMIAFILICVALVDGVLMRLMDRPTLDGRRMQTLRKIAQLAVQVAGGLMVLLVVFGTPRQMPTIIGLTTAGLTVVLQDFIIAFFGWFVLMGKHGIRVGDWVEINSVGGEVTEIGLFRTTLLETGNWTDKGHPTGRRVTFINSFAIRGQYFNFSTTGQWMWDEISVSVPASDDTYAMVEDIHKAVIQETEKDARVAEQEWKRGSRSDGLSQFSADATVNLRPSASGVDVLVRYVTRAAERFEMRNRLFQRVLDVLRRPSGETDTAPSNAS